MAVGRAMPLPPRCSPAPPRAAAAAGAAAAAAAAAAAGDAPAPPPAEPGAPPPPVPSQQLQRQNAHASAASRPGVSFSADSRSSPFDELKLREVMDGMGKLRVRQHVNPLRAEYQRPTGPIDWAAAFEDPTLPLAVDLGCGPGRFLLLLQRRAAAGRVGAGVPNGGRCNYLGLEIRRPLVDRANEWARQLGCAGRVRYVFANATVSLRGILEGYPGPIEAFYVQFPDPHFKRRHRKRRLLQPETVQAMVDALKPGGLVFLQSDVLRAAEGLRDAVEAAARGAFDPAPQHRGDGAVFFAASNRGDGAAPSGQGASPSTAAAAAAAGGRVSEAGGGDEEDPAAAWAEASAQQWSDDGGDDDGELFVSEWEAAGWLRDNPVGVPTEREYYVNETQGGGVYRLLLVRR
ncbi:tRNA (guanine-N(7)-)-methyltransferase [Raphidocelis subcapitata]|uniref:tRNA (guanine(46)-N(7))-methyltransferase n=1 Tax=Raphidocelis subcapitata TaxID=307507 RepID=A0A2V0PQU2_9CHLO|nr:tRNA (guanine-N(7)-)-methyltransferase [Raphidocelis subcapitata]|eukprot:GBF99595.1 tRNA (guanine-N(7)-)-methyltransferase [Raphidocelis subcapitata]